MRGRWLGFLWLLQASLGWADDVALVRVGEAWRYYKGTNEPSIPSTAWREVAFEDSQWLTGRSGFGFGGSDDATYLADMYLGYTSVFARKKFVLADPSTVKWLVLRLDYDDGFVAYLNGTEIARRGVLGEPGAPVPFNAVASARFTYGAEEFNVTSFTNLLVAGENVLAVQGHSTSLSAFSFSLLPELLANFQRGPFIQNTSSNRTDVIWRTPLPADGTVEFGPTEALGLAVADPVPTTNHVLTLTGLEPDTSYFYRVRSTADGETATSPLLSFRTLKTHGPVTFMALADTGQGSLAQYNIASLLQRSAPELVLHAGDVLYPYFYPPLVDTKCLSVYGPHLRSTPYFFALGNHDLYLGDLHWLAAFSLPTNTVTGTEHFYSFDHGDAHFVVLLLPTFDQLRFVVGDAQYSWLAADLAASAKPWKIIVGHLPPQSSSGHRRDDYDRNGIADRTELKDALLPLAARHGVQLILSGHEHIYERFNPTNGVHTVITGGGGAVLYGLSELDIADAQFWVRHHAVKVSIADDRMRLEALNEAGEVFDWMTIYRALPPPKVYQAAWHTPVLESKPPDDLDGNITGQAFDFVGEPIPTRPGKFSNLGQVYVNNDATTLYLGFEQTMLYGDNNLFLFIEAPRRAGVTNLLAVGNGLVDPDREGADGLDFLANLSFTNFAPTVGCLLGDEFGDSQYRSFVRPALALNIGQGVFHLDPGLSDVLGARLQQFNRSPQAGGVFGEANANFIEVAIPFAALGELQPGDTIKLGAVVGGGAFDTRPGKQSRALDSSFLGLALHELGGGEFALDGLSVQLASSPDEDGDGLDSPDERRLGIDPLDPDTDDDGLLDGWEVAHGLDALSSTGLDSGDGDPDADGLPNQLEASLGTDPRAADTDGDGLADGWEVRYQFNPRVSLGADGAEGDPDGDGWTNAQEHAADTNPRDATSLLRLALSSLSPTRHRLTWQAVVGRKYQLEWAADAAGPFTAVSHDSFPRIATAVSESFELEAHEAAASHASRFYRVRLLP
jgi:hypothetical protein